MPWVNVIANPQLRHHRHRVGRGAHLVGQQPREPADAVRQRSDQRSDRRGDLRARRRDRRGVVADAGPDARGASTGRCVVRHTAGLTQFSRRDARHRARARRLRRCRRPGEVLAADADQRRHDAADAERLRLQRVGARAAARRRAPARRHRAGRRAARSSRGTPTTRSSRGHVAFAARQRAGRVVHRGSRVVPRPQWRLAAARRRSAHAALSGRARRRRSIRARRCSCAACCSRARRRPLVFLLGQGRDREHARAADRAPRQRRRRGGGARAASRRRGTTRSTPCRCARRTTRSTR